MDSLLQDLRYALRVLRRAPGFALAVIVVLALGIGANTAIFTILDKTVIRPLPYRDPARLAALWEDFSAFGSPKSRVSPATFFDWRRRTQAFEELAAYVGPRNMDLSGGGPPEEIFGAGVTSNLFSMLGVSPTLGRTFASGEEGPGTKLVVLSHRLWARRFASDPREIGRTILLSGEPYTVIGVMPPGFQFPYQQTEFWMPLGLQPQVMTRRNSHFLRVVGRVKEGRDMRQAQSDMSGIARQLAAEFPRTNDRVGITVVPLQEDLLGDRRMAFIILLCAAACVLLIACANVGNLLLARASTRRREIAIRAAMGAGRLRLLRQVFTETLLLASAGGALGLIVAQWSMSILSRMVPPALAGSVELSLDSRVLLFALAISIVTGLFFGLAPAFQMSRVSLAGRGTIGQGKRLRDSLVVAEFAIALILIVGAGLLIETLAKLRAVDPGFRSGSILTANVYVPLTRYPTAAGRWRFYTELLRRVRAIPGVASAGLTSDLPYTSRGNTMSIAIEGRPELSNLGSDALFRLVSSGYFETLGVRLTAGRLLNDSDGPDAPPVVVVSESLARQYWPNQNPLGRRIDSGTGGNESRWMTVVGVVSDMRERGLDYSLKPAVYIPYTQTAIDFFLPSEIAVKTAREPLSLSQELQKAVWSVDAEQPVSDIRTLDDIVDGELANRTQVLQLLGGFAALALLLAALGVYSVLSYAVSGRMGEMGLRMAVGATRSDIVRLILGYSARLAGVGLSIGILGAAASTRLLGNLLFGVSPLDPKVFASVCAILACAALLAAYVPARRAASVDPVAALRQE